jgi:hypothetical protein
MVAGSDVLLVKVLAALVGGAGLLLVALWAWPLKRVYRRISTKQRLLHRKKEPEGAAKEEDSGWEGGILSLGTHWINIPPSTAMILLW